MNLKSISFGAAVATAVVSSATLASAPAQAFDLYSKTLGFGGKAALYETTTGTDPSNYFTLDFFAQPGGTGTPLVGQTPTGVATLLGSDPIFGSEDQKFNLQDLTLSKSGSVYSLVGGTVVDFITGLNNNIKFTLTGFNLAKDAVNGGFAAGFEGFFTAPPKFANVPIFPGNNFTSQTSLTNLKFTNNVLDTTKSGSTYSADLTSIPTPALLPGLVGMGLAAWRKRKGESVEQSEA